MGCERAEEYMPVFCLRTSFLEIVNECRHQRWREHRHGRNALPLQVTGKPVQTVCVMANGRFLQAAFFSQIGKESRCIVFKRKRLALATAFDLAVERESKHLYYRASCFLRDLAQCIDRFAGRPMHSLPMLRKFLNMQ